MNIFQTIWRKYAPDGFLLYSRYLSASKKSRKRSRAVVDFYKDKKNLPSEIVEGISFLKYGKFSVQPFRWTLKYDRMEPDVRFDEKHKRFYLKYFGKNLYFRKDYTKAYAIYVSRSLLREQDVRSAHVYLTSDFQLERGSIVVDGGVAEGNFALSIVDQAKKLYLIECDPEWVETLKITFAPWKEKVVFIEKFLSNTNDRKNITLDEMIHPNPCENYFIKMDIEGYEKKALAGAQQLLSCGSHVKLAICTYHYADDLKNISTIVGGYGFTWKPSDGFILYYGEGEEPRFRRALLRADNKQVSN